ncbi:hypothetical protein ACIHCQ_42290 [Streptomyces sp. NPDC052236]|uniref:hypothetical protein n=1 Tax=Streptomyces sp. NPDC052236 TaxID=3365686 RepID=UPI0037CFE7A3
MLNRITTFIYGLFGRALVYESTEQLNEVLEKQAFDKNRSLAGHHFKEAAKLSDPYAFQPGLVDLHGELHHTWIYLSALEAQARRDGYDTLANHLVGAADNTLSTMRLVASAAEATIPVSETPATSR